MEIDLVLDKCEIYLQQQGYASYDPFDALTSRLISSVCSGSPLLRRIAIQVNSKSPINLHWLGMKKMVHTKTISDLLWYHSVNANQNRNELVNKYYGELIKLKNADGYGWGLNFPYTSRFITADEHMPNLYNTVNSGIAICYALPFLNAQNKQAAEIVIKGIVKFMDNSLGFVDEENKGWYLYYPGQSYPTYNVNALSLYFLAFVKELGLSDASTDKKIEQLINLLCDEQSPDGSWNYSRSPKGKWIDGFHSGFVVESLAFACKHGQNSAMLEGSLKKGWDFYVGKMFTADGYPKYFSTSDKYPVEAQNCAQAIQTLSNMNSWFSWETKGLLEKVIQNTFDDLYDSRGYFYFKKTRYYTYKQPYIRWSITPMMLALAYTKLT